MQIISAKKCKSENLRMIPLGVIIKAVMSRPLEIGEMHVFIT